MNQPVTTWWQNPARDISLEFSDGELVAVNIESGLIDPSRDNELETGLIAALNAALEQHTSDCLEHIREPDPLREQVERHAREAVTAAITHARHADPPRPDSEPPVSDIMLTWGHGRITDVRISYDLLAAGRARAVGDALIQAVNTPDPTDSPDLELLNQLDATTIRRDLERTVEAITATSRRF